MSGEIIPYPNVDANESTTTVRAMITRLEDNDLALEVAILALQSASSQKAKRCRLAKVNSGDSGSGNQSIPNATTTLVSFTGSGDEISDPDNLHSISSNPSRITFDRNGTYSALVAAKFESNAMGTRRIVLKLNGNIVAEDEKDAHPTEDTLVHILALGIETNATDYLELEVYQDSGVALNVLSSPLTNPSGTRLEMVEVGLGTIPESGQELLATISSINAKTVATTNLKTVSTGTKVHVSALDIICTEATAITVPPEISLIIDPGTKIVIPNQRLTGLTTSDNGWLFQVHGLRPLALASETIKLSIDTGATGTSMTVEANLYGEVR